MSHARSAIRLSTVTAGATGLLILAAAAAPAHVTVTPTTTAAGSYGVLTFSVGHGCDGSPTTELAFQIPEQIVTVTPSVNPNWTIEKKMQALDQPVDDGHGGQYTERVAEVVYSAKTPLADGYRDTMALSLQLPDAEGEKLVFPVVQTCKEGETAWTQTYEEGQDEPPAPAPFIEVTATEDDGHGDSHAAQTTASDDESGSNAVGWAGVALGGLGLGVGGIALARGRKSA